MPMIDRLVDAAGAKGWGAQYLLPIANAALNGQHFVFDDVAKSAIENIAYSKPSSLLRAIELAALPFQNCWFEWRGGVSASYEDRRRQPADGETIPKTVGFLAEATTGGPRRLMISAVWEFPNGLFSVNPASLWVDWEAQPDPNLLDHTRQNSALDPAFERELPPSERESATRFFERMALTTCPYTEKYQRDLAAMKGPQVLKDLAVIGERDIQGEAQLIIGALCVLNARNYVAIEPADLSTINRAREKRGRRPLVSYSTVRIKLSNADRRAAKEMGATPEEMRRHIVRGHFKVRRGGIFWWRPYLRGSLKHGEVRRERYEVGKI